MMRHLVRLLLALLLSTFSALAFAVEILKWERLPLSVPLRVDEERIIFIDKNVRVGLDRSVSGQVRVQSVAGALYIKALDEIPMSRMQIQVVETGEIILVDIFTVEEDASTETSEPVRIVDGRRQATADEEAEDSYAAKAAESLKIPAPVALTRYAAQNLYAPLRTVEPVPGLRKVGHRAHNRLRLFPTEQIIGYPLVAYKLGAYTTTAVKLVNLSQSPIELDPRKLQGDFYSVAFQHGWLGRTGTAEDTTVAYITTVGKGLDQAMLPMSLIPETAMLVPEKAKKDSKKEGGK